MSEIGYVPVEDFADGKNETRPEREKRIVDRFMGLFRQYEDASQWYYNKLRENRDLYKQQALGQRESTEQRWEFKQAHRDLLDGAPFTTTPTLLTSVENLKADLMQGYPEAIFLGRESSDAPFAETMTSLHKMLMERRHHKAKHRDAITSMLIYGVGYVESYWDDELENGKGDVDFNAWEPFNIYVDPYCEDIQEGRAVIKRVFHPLSWYKEHYPDRFDEMDANMQANHRHVETQDYVSGTDYQQEALLEVWYKKYDADTHKNRVHMAKIAGGVLLYCSEEDHPEGVYAHGLYPFVPYICNRIPGTPWGYGMYDYLGNLQKYIDEVDQMMLKNIVSAGKMRMLLNRASGIDATKAADLDQDVIEGDRIDDAAIRWVQGAPLHPYALTMYQIKIDSLRDESGQNNAARGQVGGGITAASAIESLQSAALKRSNLLRSIVQGCYEETVRMDVELMLDKYDDDRVVRVEGKEIGTYSYYGFGNAKKLSFGDETKHRFEYDLSVKIQQQPEFQQQAQNETMLEMVRQQALPPEVALELMHFDDKPRILQALRWNSQMMKNMQQQAAATKQAMDEMAQIQQENEALRTALINLQQSGVMTNTGGMPVGNMPVAGAQPGAF